MSAYHKVSGGPRFGCQTSRQSLQGDLIRREQVDATQSLAENNSMPMNMYRKTIIQTMESHMAKASHARPLSRQTAPDDHRTACCAANGQGASSSANQQHGRKAMSFRTGPRLRTWARGMASRAAPEMGVGVADLTGETFLVTGSTDGIGLHTAQRMAQAGATVLVHGRSVPPLDARTQRKDPFLFHPLPWVPVGFLVRSTGTKSGWTAPSNASVTQRAAPGCIHTWQTCPAWRACVTWRGACARTAGS